MTPFQKRKKNVWVTLIYVKCFEIEMDKSGQDKDFV